MKKIIISALCILLCLSLVACGEKSPGGTTGPKNDNAVNETAGNKNSDNDADKELMGAISIENGNLAVYDIPLGMNIRDAQKKMAEKGLIEEPEYEDGMTALEYELEKPLEINGMEVEEIAYISLEKDGKIDLFALEVDELEVKKDLVNSPEELKTEVKKYFEKYQTPLKDVKNRFETALEGQSVMDGEKVIFDEGSMIYTYAFVNGETVPINSKRLADLSETENAQVLEICYVTQPITENQAKRILKDDDKTFSPAYVQFMIGDADALKYMTENGRVDF